MITYVYVLKSKKDNTLYIGLTTDIKNRLDKHNLGLNKFTKGHLPYSLIFYCAFPNKFIAAKFEKYLKSASGKGFLNKRLIK